MFKFQLSRIIPAMAGSKSSSPPSIISIGNCKVEVDGNNFICESERNYLQISVNDAAKIKISVEGEGDSSVRDHLFMLVNPKDIDSRSKSLLQEVLNTYMKELPTMNYAANTGKESLFLERCVSSGKYCTLLLKSNSIEGSEKVIAAATYQIIPADTKYAEIPLAAVHSNYQHKGIGHLLYMELRKRLQNVGICTIFCWGDKESEGFWLKQGFVPIAEVDVRGRARRLPIKADIRRSLCFPGGSTLMVSHLNKDISIPANPSDSLKVCFPLKLHVKLPSSVPFKGEGLGGIMEYHDTPKSLNQFIPEIENPRLQMFVKDGCSTDDNKFEGSSHIHDSIQGCTDLVPWNGLDCNNTVTDLGMAENGDDADVKHCSCSAPGLKKRVWEASWSSLKSKKVKGGHHIDCHLDSDWDFVSEHGRENGSCFGGCSRGTSRVKSLVEAEPIPKDSLEIPCMTIHAEESSPVPIMSNKDQISEEFQSKDECLKIMLMNIVDDAKKTRLTKIIEDLGGAVTSNGSVSTHVITGKARRTLNFCTALCSGAWIISPSWLKASFREGRFVGGLPFVLQDEEYVLKYRSELKDAILRAKVSPRALLKGYEICLTKHIQPPVDILSAIVRSAGGNVIQDVDKVHEPSTTIFVACEEDMEEALLAVKRGIWTFSSDWFMNCVMRQELDLEAPQFAESL